MALLQPAIEYTLKLEDSTLSGVITQIPGDKGGLTRFGISKVSHPELAATGFFGPMARLDAMLLASQTYGQYYADPLQIPQITDQTVANIFLAYGVNAGTRTAIELMQAVLGALQIDGILGPQTLRAINIADSSLEYRFRLAMIQHYLALNQPQFLEGWVRRALA